MKEFYEPHSLPSQAEVSQILSALRVDLNMNIFSLRVFSMQKLLKYYNLSFKFKQVSTFAFMMKQSPSQPTKVFFSELGNELCNMKNSPFSRIGQAKQPSQNQTVLSYAPDRLFNPQKHKQKMEAIEQQSYKKQLKQQEQKEQFKIQYDMLKRNTNQEYLKQVQKMKQMRRFDHKQPYSWFGAYRGTCVLCGKCTQYEGCFSYSQMHSMGVNQFVDNAYYSGYNDKIQLMQCYKCHCPMNSHVALPHIPTLRNQFYKALIHKNIQDNYLKFNHIVLAFKLPQQNLQHFHNIIQLLRSLNCPVVNYKSFSKLSFELALIKSSIIQNGNTQKLYIESLLNLLQSIKIEKEWKWSQSKYHINQMYEELYDILRKVGMKIQADMGIGDRECVLVVLCRYEIGDVRNLIRYLSGKSRVSYVPQRSGTNSTNASSISSNRNSNFSHNSYDPDIQQTDMSMLQQKYNMKFIYGTNERKQAIILSQYFFKENYQIIYKIFMLPGGSLTAGTSNEDISKNRNQQQYNSARFKDILDYNNFIVFLENFREVDRASFEEVMSKVIGFRSSKIDYIMGEELLHQKIKKLGIKLSVKIGTPNLTIPFQNIPDFITIKNTNKMQIPKILKAIYPQFTYSQRCIFIIRPFIMNSNFEEVIVNLLRINKFVLLKRVQVKLSQAEAKYLATLEAVDDQMLDTYVKYMTTGVCEIILTSKRAAIYEAYALAHGCLSGPSDIPAKNLKNVQSRGTSNAITVQIKKNRQIYEQQLPLYTHTHQTRNIHFPTPSTQAFKSIRQLIDIQKVLFGYNYPPQYATNIRNGEVTKIDPLISSSSTAHTSATHAHSHVNFSHKIKQSMLKELKKENFNFWVFTSKSESLTEQLASIFLPQCTLFEPITVLVKPGLYHLVPMIRKALLEHKYHIIVEKQLQMSNAIATQFVYNCQKIKMNKQTLKYIIDAYTKQKVYIFCLSKVSGRKQIMSMLSGYTFLTNISQGMGGSSKQTGNFKQPIGMFAQDEFISDQMLYDMLVPVWNNEELCLRMIAQPLANLEESIRIICEYNEGEPAVQNKNPIKKSDRFIVLNYLVGSFFGVSIENIELDTKLGRLSIILSDIPEIPRLQSWYYAQISNIKPNYVPLLFQYRLIGQTMVCIQSNKGTQFMDMIIKMYNAEQSSAKVSQQNQANNFSLRPTKKQKRRSLVLFLWGKKLSELCLDLAQVTTQLNDFGEIVYKNGQFRGADTLQQTQLKEYGFLSRLHHDFEHQKDIKYNIKKMMDTRHQKQRYQAQNKRLLPSFILAGLQECIRVIEKTQTSKLNLMDKYSFVDPENQMAKQKDLYSLHLFNVVPEIRTKYSMAAQIYYFFVKAQFQHPELTEMIAEIQQIFSDMLSDVEDLDIIQFQIYLRFLIEFERMPPQDEFKSKLFNILKSYPNLRKNKRIQRDDVAGKKRKIIEHKQYFRRKDEQNEDAKETIQKKYVDFDLNSLRQEVKPSILYDPKDPLHYRFANVENRVNLLRETKHQQQRNGVYVQFEKNISEKEELLKQKIKKQAERFNYQKEDQILRQTGLERDLWYRRTKGQKKQTVQSKTNTAIQKQIERLINFKKEQEKKNGSKNSQK